MVLHRHWGARKSAHCVSSHWVVDSTNDTMSLSQTPLNQENPLLTSQPAPYKATQQPTWGSDLGAQSQVCSKPLGWATTLSFLFLTFTFELLIMFSDLQG